MTFREVISAAKKACEENNIPEQHAILLLLEMADMESHNLYYEYENFWQKQKDLNVNERLNNLYFLGYDYIILSDFAENFKSDGDSLDVLLGTPVKTTTHIRIYNLNNSNNINIETAKERFYELYTKQ